MDFFKKQMFNFIRMKINGIGKLKEPGIMH